MNYVIRVTPTADPREFAAKLYSADSKYICSGLIPGNGLERIRAKLWQSNPSFRTDESSSISLEFAPSIDDDTANILRSYVFAFLHSRYVVSNQTPSTRLPFDPTALISRLTSLANSQALTGDWQERFQRIYQQKGRLSATLWFFAELRRSLPPLVVAALRPQPKKPVPVALILSESISITDSVQVAIFPPCRNPGECYSGTIGWQWKDEIGSQAGACDNCGTFHIRCGNCGELGWYHEEHIVKCDGCGMKWQLSFEDGMVDRFEHFADPED